MIEQTSVGLGDIEQGTRKIEADSIMSCPALHKPAVKTVLFGFTPGLELSEQTSARPAILHFLRGRAQLTPGGEAMVAQPGTFVYLPSHLSHTMRAETELVMLLQLLPRETAA